MVQEIIAGVDGIFRVVNFLLSKIYKARDEATQRIVKKYCPSKITPNILSGSRIVGGLVILYLLTRSTDNIFAVQIIFPVLALTDALDGSVARAFNLETEFGGFLDRMADKILICPIVAIIMWQLDKILVFLICGGEIISTVLAVYAFKNNISAKANVWGEYKMSLQSIGIALIIFSQVTLGSKILWISVGFGLASIVGHIRARQS